MNTIRLYQDPEANAWIADWSGTKDAAKVRKLFGGVAVLPTPFTLQAPRLEVVRAIEKQNPGYCVAVIDKPVIGTARIEADTRGDYQRSTLERLTWLCPACGYTGNDWTEHDADCTLVCPNCTKPFMLSLVPV